MADEDGIPAGGERAPTASGAAGPWWVGGLLVLAAILVYLPALSCGFVWDDDAFVTANPLIQASDGLARFWFSSEPPDYFPLTSTTLWIEWRLWGDDATGYHAVNVGLHALSVLLLWRVLLRLRVPGAWIGALLFALHPVNVESVVWITQRKNTLPMVFYLASILAWLRAEDGGGRRDWGLALVAFLLALLSKTNVVTLPVVLLLLAWWRRGRVDGGDLRRTAPFFVLSLALGLVTVWYQTTRAIGDQVVREDGLVSRAAVAGRAVWFYLGKALAPVELCFIYPRWDIPSTGAADFLPLVGLVALLGVLFAFRSSWGRAPLTGLAYYVVSLLPILGFVNIYFMRYALVADHYQYTALLGLAALAGAGLVRLASRVGQPMLAPAVGLVLAAALGWGTWNRQAAYADLESLWEDTLATNPDAFLAHNNLGAIRLDQGRAEEAIGHAEAALVAFPDYPEAHYNLGRALQSVGRLDEAAASYVAALALEPDNARAHNNLGLITQAGGDLPRALEHFVRAVELDPAYAGAASNLAVALQAAGRFAEAAHHHEEAVRLDGASPIYLDRWARLLASCPDPGVRDPARAVQVAQRAVDASGGANAIPLSTLADAHLALGDPSRAAATLERAIAVASPAQRAALTQRLEQLRARNP